MMIICKSQRLHSCKHVGLAYLFCFVFLVVRTRQKCLSIKQILSRQEQSLQGFLICFYHFLHVFDESCGDFFQEANSMYRIFLNIEALEYKPLELIKKSNKTTVRWKPHRIKPFSLLIEENKSNDMQQKILYIACFFFNC